MTLLEHPRPELVRHEQGALDVDVDDTVEGLLGELAPRHLLGRHVADVVDEHVEHAGRLEHFVGQPLDLIPRGDVGLEDEGRPAERFDALDRAAAPASERL